MMQWVIGSILHGGPIKLFLVLASALRLVYHGVSWCMLSCLWDNAYKRTVAANRKK